MDTDKQKLLLALQNNPKVQEYLADFEEKSAKDFLENYASKKELFLLYGEGWKNTRDYRAGYFRACAERYYWIIAQKKLFNKQCLWRAGQVDLPLEITADFSYWEHNIQNCAFIEDVTEDEIEAMIQYLEQAPYYHEDEEPEDWQEYSFFKDETTTGTGTNDDYPEWYHFYDTRFSTSYLTLLPDLIGAREEKYICAWAISIHSKAQHIYNQKPSIHFNSERTEEFIQKIEPYQILEYYRLYNKTQERIDFMWQLEKVLELFKEEDDEVPIPEGKFPDAIFRAFHMLKVSKLKLLLPEVHQSHMERKAMGISYEETYQAYHTEQAPEIKKQIEEGKRLLGEL
jgi:hypothetical protein